MTIRFWIPRPEIKFIFTALIVMLGTVAGISGETEVNTDGVLELSGRFSVAHACPVSDTYVLTAAHVTDLRPNDRNFPLYPYRFSNQSGDYGIAIPVSVFTEVDLGWMRVRKPLTHYYKMSERTPKVDDEITWVDYNFDKKGKALQPDIRTARIVTISAGHFIVDDGPVSGSSGGCVWNEYGEVIGIVSSAWTIGSNYKPNAGGMAAVYGEWMPEFPKMKEE